MKVKVIDYKEYQSNTLQAFIDLELTEIGLTINGCSLHSKEGRDWVSMPQREYETKEGGKKWASILWWGSKETANDFRESALKAIEGFKVKGKSAERKPDDREPDIPF